MTETIFEAKTGGFTIQRTPYFSLCLERRAVPIAEIHISDTGYELYKAVVKDDPVEIKFGYRDGEQGEFKGEIIEKSAIGDNLTRIVAAGAEYAFVKTYITESYNDEQPSVIIKQLAGMAGIAVGKLDIPDDPVQHIILSNITAWQAFGQLRNIMLRNGCKKELDFWVYDGKLNWGGFNHDKITDAAVKQDIISHEIKDNGYSVLALPLTPELRHSELIRIDDDRRSVSGSFKIYSVRHLYEGTTTRTSVGYKL